VLYRLKLLIVDDEPDMREALKLVLVHSRAQVIAVATASEGLEKLQRPTGPMSLSAILACLRWGYEFIRLVRKLPAELGGQTPAVALTAFNLWAERTL
jgi:CheY-like chemotaxis protein